ncbi:hypothetical protein C2G38_2036328 [Gigaspora rosea]|uniref:Uncharacterized protein n=1 Tax=Gigaspora rosea TaxID=44941 RepID=A0A397VAZ0_9GLOM|nr:hypothetical protein C2G38_2036328 [Gigaspora rosea]
MGNVAIPNGTTVWNANTSGSFPAEPIYEFNKEVNKWVQFAHLQYYSEYKKHFEDLLKEQQTFLLKHPYNEEKLYSLSKEHMMSKTEIQKVKQYYATVFDLTISCINITNKIQKYGKLRTKFGVTISSKLANHKGDFARNNYSIVARLLVDKNAHRPRAPIEFEEQEFYGQVLFYFMHEYEGKVFMLAYVQWIRNPEVYGNNILYFRNFGKTGVINVATIDRCVRFLKLKANKHIIIDRENWVTFR